MIVKRGMYRGEFLQRFYPSESQHRQRSSPEWQVRILGPVVEPAAHLASDEIAHVTHRGGVRTKTVGDNLLGPAMPFQCLLHESQRRFLVSGPSERHR